MPSDCSLNRAIRESPLRISCALWASDDKACMTPFGDKRALFLSALREYAAASCAALTTELARPGPPLEMIQKALISFAERKDMVSSEGCMGLNAVSEFGLRDEEVTHTIRAAAPSLRRTLRGLLQSAVKRSELPEVEIESAIDFVDAILAGIRYAAKAGKSRKALREMASFAGGPLNRGAPL